MLVAARACKMTVSKTAAMSDRRSAGARARYVAALELGLDHRRQQLRDKQRVAVARVVDRDAQQCGGDRGVPLREAQHGEPGCGSLPYSTRVVERRRGGGEIAAPQLDLSDLVPRLTDVQRIQAFQQPHRLRSADSAATQSPRTE